MPSSAADPDAVRDTGTGPEPPATGTRHAVPIGGRPIPRELANNPDYEIIRELGGGGMGLVFLAHNRIMGRDEVLKVISRDIDR